MDTIFIEVKSAIWQKILASVVALIIFVPGVGGCLSPFVPIFVGEQPSLAEGLFIGVICIATSLGFWWPVMRYSIRADKTGIVQTNGFFRQSVRWDEVAYYYTEPNRRFYSESRHHIEPVLFNADGQVIFCGFAHILVSTRKIIEQRRQLWEFVDAQLEGKKVDAPSPDLVPEVLAQRELAATWSNKSVAWKVRRVLLLICYTAFWLAFSMVPIYYIVSNNLSVPKPWGAFIILPMFIGPMLPTIIYLHVKKRKIAKELKDMGK